MFIHIGDAKIAMFNELIGIFDMKIVDNNEDNVNFLEFAKKEENSADEKNRAKKSFVVTDDLIYFSPVSSLTLAGREKKYENYH